MKLTKVTKDGSRSLYGQFLTMTLLPLIIIGIGMIFACSYFLKTGMQQEANENLENMAAAVMSAYDTMYPGEYEAKLNETGDGAVLYKGGQYISDSYEFIDRIKSDSNLEISVFMYDTRLLTTLTDSKGVRAVGTVANEAIMSAVYGSGQGVFFNNVSIENTDYYAYYMPIVSEDDGQVVGMIGVAQPALEVQSSISRAIWVNVIIMVLAIAVTAAFILFFANRTVLMIKCMIDFMKKLSDNKLDAVLDERVTHRADELGVMGRMLVDLQISLRRLIERDALTGLFNRRSGEKKIDKIEKMGIKYCVAIGDIDFFKKFNDSFGHACGDAVLKEVALTLARGIGKRGFVARWGGEEFLLVFENMEIDEAYAILMDIRETFHEKGIAYMDQIHKVTMTFGLTAKIEGKKVNEVIREADDKLYLGKEGGRDRVIK